MENRGEKAVWLKHNGHNCCQAVLAAFAGEAGLEPETLKKLGAAFGTGMGCMEATCGALCGAEMLLGLAEYQGAPLRARAKEMYRVFEERCGATLCKDLKGVATGQMLCSCDDCVRLAADIAEEMLLWGGEETA